MLHSRIGKTTKTIRSQNLFAIALLAALAFTTTIVRAQDPLPSWNDGPAKLKELAAAKQALQAKE
jgi:hypothetical protein